ncbi:MAG: tRNA pseudouridine(55) synthase TruB [Kineosporiaceae bacterium]
MTAEDGLVVVDKPEGLTSHDVVARVRRLAGTRRVGHAGTLDPMATGVLVVGVERATRMLTFLVGADKEYEATIRLGAATVTDDREGEVTSATPVPELDDVELSHAVQRLTGVLQQVPSSVSAVKIDGKRAYARVREGEDVVLDPRRVTVRRFEVLARRPGDLDGVPVVDVDVRVACSSGTYVRALARDLGVDLGVGGHLTALRRTRVGRFGLDAARSLSELEADFSVVPMPVVARHLFPVWELDEDQARRLSHGMRLPAGDHPESVPVAAFAPDGRLVAITAVTGPVARPLLVVAPA